MNYTAGPWRVGHTMNSTIKKNRAIVANYNTPDEVLIAEVWGNETESECGANARLIAASPMMYETLIQAKGLMASGYNDEALKLIHKTLADIDSAIAKAE